MLDLSFGFSRIRSASGDNHNAERRTESRRVLQRMESGAALTAERLAARPVDTFTNDERNVIGTSDLSGKSIPP